jgi:hypothetical protein
MRSGDASCTPVACVSCSGETFLPGVVATDLATEHGGTDANKRDGARRVARLNVADLIYETERIGEDRDRVAHNPEVAGSNPVPATSGNGTRRILRGPFSCPMTTDLATLARFTS